MLDSTANCAYNTADLNLRLLIFSALLAVGVHIILCICRPHDAPFWGKIEENPDTKRYLCLVKIESFGL